jgi:hypothetical protein
MTIPSFEKGKLMVMRLHEFADQYREVATAKGTMGRPERLLIIMIPGPAFRAGPGGTSAVKATLKPSRSEAISP